MPAGGRLDLERGALAGEPGLGGPAARRRRPRRLGPLRPRRAARSSSGGRPTTWPAAQNAILEAGLPADPRPPAGRGPVSGPTAYLDHAAAPVLDPRVRRGDAAVPGRASSAARRACTSGGGAPAEALERARDQVAALVGAEPRVDHLHLGRHRGAQPGGDRAAAGQPAPGPPHRDERRGAPRHGGGLPHAPCATGPTWTWCRWTGRASWTRPPSRRRCGDDTALVAVVHGQPDIGTLQDVGRPGVGGPRRAARGARGDRRRRDGRPASRSTSWRWGADAVPIGGGSVGAPPWVGALVVRPGARLHPIIEGGAAGGGQARRRREPAGHRRPGRRRRDRRRGDGRIAPPACAPSRTGSWPACSRCPTCG